MGVDYDALINKFHEYVDKNAAKGTPISDKPAYFLKMACDEAEKLLRTQVDPHAITSPNEWVRGAALARAMGTPPQYRVPPESIALPDRQELERVNKRLLADGLDPDEVLAAWRKARQDRSARVNYRTFADAKRTERRNGKRSAQHSMREAILAFRVGDSVPQTRQGMTAAELAAAGASKDEITQILGKVA